MVAPEARLLSTPRVQGARFSPAEPIGALPRPTTARRIASSSTPPARLLLPRRSRPARAPRGRVRHARRAPIACQAAATRAAAQDPRALARPRSIGACACTAAAMAGKMVSGLAILICFNDSFDEDIGANPTDKLRIVIKAKAVLGACLDLAGPGWPAPFFAGGVSPVGDAGSRRGWLTSLPSEKVSRTHVG